MHLEIIYFTAKILGMILVLFGCGGTGFQLSLNMKRRLEQLNEMKKMVLLLRGEIRYTGTPLPEALNRISNKTARPFDNFLKQLRSELSLMAGDSFSEIWTRNIDMHLTGSNLKQEDLIMLKGLGNSLGYLDKEMQLGAIDLFMEHLENSIGEQIKSIPGKQRICNCLGILSGVFIVVLLV